MGLQIIIAGDNGGDIRNQLNSMLAELYGAILPPIYLPGLTGNSQTVIKGGQMLDLIIVNPTAGSPTINIGTTPNGTNIVPQMILTQPAPVIVSQPFAADQTLYVTITGGTVAITIYTRPFTS